MYCFSESVLEHSYHLVIFVAFHLQNVLALISFFHFLVILWSQMTMNILSKILRVCFQFCNFIFFFLPSKNILLSLLVIEWALWKIWHDCMIFKELDMLDIKFLCEYYLNVHVSTCWELLTQCYCLSTKKSVDFHSPVRQFTSLGWWS